jgi:alkaline phosphatase D
MRNQKLPVLFAACLALATPVFSQQSTPKTGEKPKTDLQEKSGEKAPTPVTYDAKQKAKEAAFEAIEVTDRDAYDPKPIDTTMGLAVIAFGSCNKMDKPQTLWADILNSSPNLWIWLGDIIYADTSDMKALAAHYKLLKTTPGYKKLRSKAQVIGIYDDHDYGKNDACKNQPLKRSSKKCLMDFLDVPMNSPVRKREGAYQSYTFGQGSQRIKIILMDTRYFRDTLKPDPTKQKRYLPNETGDMLGEAQWKWLEKELRTSQANLNILCSSVQIIPDEHGYEKWGNFPAARKRLLNLIVQTKPKNLLLLSGDRHMAEISKMDLQGLPYPLYEFTSSGMTHIRSGTNEPNKFRSGDMIVKRNFGLLKIYWVNDKPVVTMQIRGHENELYQETVVKF